MTLPPLPEPAGDLLREDSASYWGRAECAGYTSDQVRAYGEACALAERERCAAVCEGVREAADHSARDGHRKTGAMASAALCAKLIRA